MITSGFAKLILLAAAFYALLTAGETWMAIETMLSAYDSQQAKIFQFSATVVRWAIDPIFLCGTAVMIELLERIWRELLKANAGRDPGK